MPLWHPGGTIWLQKHRLFAGSLVVYITPQLCIEPKKRNVCGFRCTGRIKTESDLLSLSLFLLSKVKCLQPHWTNMRFLSNSPQETVNSISKIATRPDLRNL